MIALVIGTLLAVGALAYVLAPLFLPARPAAPGPRPAAAREDSSERDVAIAALREIEFDRATGKLSEPDYAELKAAYTQRALAAMRAEDAATGAPDVPGAPVLSDAAIEARILEYRQRRPICPTCGPRPELDARWCSSCGTWLDGRCGHCGEAVSEPGARFCSACGKGLAA